MKTIPYIIALLNATLLVLFPSRPAFGFTLLFWIFFLGCIGYIRVVAMTSGNDSSSDSAPPPMSY